jgi:hypothetical protein
MSFFAWSMLIFTAFIFIALGAGVFVFLTFFYNDGAAPGLSIFFLLVFFAIMSTQANNLMGTPVLQASIIAGFFLFTILCLVAHYLIPHLDNSDLVKAARPIIYFSMTAGLLIVAVNLAKIIMP